MKRTRPSRAPLWLLVGLGFVAVALFPWTAYLGVTLPARHVTHHWDWAWPALDVFEGLALAATVVALVRRACWASPLAAIAGTALLCDAWFDTITANGSGELRWSLVSLAFELPLAAVCYWVAFVEAGKLNAAARASAAGPQPTARPSRPAAGRAVARTSGSAVPSEGRTSR